MEMMDITAMQHILHYTKHTSKISATETYLRKRVCTAARKNGHKYCYITFSDIIWLPLQALRKAGQPKYQGVRTEATRR